MISATLEKPKRGSVRNRGDRVHFVIVEDKDGIEYGNGTVIGEKDADTAIVEIVLKGRRKDYRDELEIPYADLIPNMPEIKEEVEK